MLKLLSVSPFTDKFSQLFLVSLDPRERKKAKIGLHVKYIIHINNSMISGKSYLSYNFPVKIPSKYEYTS